MTHKNYNLKTINKIKNHTHRQAEYFISNFQCLFVLFDESTS